MLGTLKLYNERRVEIYQIYKSGFYSKISKTCAKKSRNTKLKQAYFLSILRKTQNKKTLSFSKTQPIFPKNSTKLTQKLNAPEVFTK